MALVRVPGGTGLGYTGDSTAARSHRSHRPPWLVARKVPYRRRDTRSTRHHTRRWPTRCRDVGTAGPGEPFPCRSRTRPMASRRQTRCIDVSCTWLEPVAAVRRRPPTSLTPTNNLLNIKDIKLKLTNSGFEKDQRIVWGKI